MKFIKRLLLFIFILMMSGIFILPLLFDKSQIVSNLKDTFSEKSGYVIRFSEDSQLVLFPDPKIILSDVKIHEKKKIKRVFASSEKLEIITSWGSLFSGKFKMEKFLLKNTKIMLLDLNNGFPNFTNKNLVNLDNFESENIFELVSSLGEVVVEDGQFIYQKGKNIFLLSEMNLLVENKEKKNLTGNFFFENIQSKIKIDFSTQDFLSFEIFMEQITNQKNNTIFWDLHLTNLKNKNFFLSGKVKSEYLLSNELIFKNYFSDINLNTQDFFNSSINDKLNFSVNLDVKLKDFFIKKIPFKDTSFRIKFNDNILKVLDLKTNHHSSTINYTSTYLINKNLLSGDLNVNNLKLKHWLKDNEIGIAGGDLHLKLNFINKNLNIKNLKKNLNLNGSYRIEQPILKGIDFDSSIEKIKNISSINDILKLIKSDISQGKTRFDYSSGNFSFSNDKLFLKNLITERKNLLINSKGFLDTKNFEVKIENNIKILEKPLSDLPRFGITLFGPFNDLNVKYNLKDFREAFLEKTLNKILKDNKKILLDKKTIIDFLSPDQ